MEFLGETMTRGSDFRIGMYFKADDGKTGAVVITTEALEDHFGASGNHEEVATQNADVIGAVAKQRYDGTFPVELTAADLGSTE